MILYQKETKKPMNIFLVQAQHDNTAVKNKAVSLIVKIIIATVDAGANILAFARMDGAWLVSVDIEIKKAKTARFFDMEAGLIGELSQPGVPLFTIEHSDQGLITFSGEIPIKN